MKRAEGEVKEGQGVGEREVKSSKTGEESTEVEESSSPDFNPFLIEPILRKMLKKVDTVAQLKDLRKMCVLWDNVNMEELEERAFKGKLKMIDFKWTDRFKCKEEAEKELVEFLEDTRAISRLFNAFKFNIPESLKVLRDHTAFFSDYTISRVEFVIHRGIFIYNLPDALKYFLSLIEKNLKEIQMPHTKIHDDPISFEPKAPNWPKPELFLPKLEMLIIENKHNVELLADFFKSVLGFKPYAIAYISAGKGSETGRITSLKLTPPPGVDIGSFPGLDPTRMTRLDIGGEFEEGISALKYTTGLMNLVEKGMKLLDLGIKFGSCHDTPTSLAQNLPSICSNITHILATQSSTLTTLNLRLEFYETLLGSEDEIRAEIAAYGKIKLPIFEALHTLSFDHLVQISNENIKTRTLEFSLFETTHSLPLHFPSLVNLTFKDECSMGLFFVNPGQMELAGNSQFHFKQLQIKNSFWIDRIDRWKSISEPHGIWKMLYGALIGSVDYLRVPREVLEKVRIPWADSLRELSIKGYGMPEPLKLAHLKKLETLTIFENLRKIGYEKIPGSDIYEESVSEYLSWFSEATQLSLTYIKFIGLEIEDDVIKEKFNRYFPFPVQFEKKFGQ